MNEMIETEQERQNWKDYLMEQSKEDLVELIIDKMTRDLYFTREIECKFMRTEASVDEMIEEYTKAVKTEMGERVPNMDFLETLSDKVMETASATENLLEKIKIYVSVIINLDDALEYGAGFEAENEYILFEKMDKCRNQMIIRIEEKNHKMSPNECDEIYNLLKGESECYNSLDGDNRIEDVFKKFVSITNGRTRITKTGGYVRGAEYYANLNK